MFKKNNEYCIKEDIKEIRQDNYEQKKVVSRYIKLDLIKSFIIFGYNHRITKECYKLYKQLNEIIDYENYLYYIINKNRIKINYSEFGEFIDNLDELNADTISYFYQMLDDIEDACDTKQEYRAQHFKRDFKFINESDDYYNETLGLTLSDSDILKFLNYSDDFWNYIRPRIRRVDYHDDDKNKLYEVVMHMDSNNCLDDMRVYVPYVINLKTALINVHEFKHANDLYYLLGSNVPEDSNPYEESAREKENEFVKKYLPNIKIKK